jgi:RND superfamily putative drug exporter
VIRTVGSTGGVITAAGLIFAASMFGLLFASITMMVQAGFVLGMGILLDTFLVRTVTVPAIATLVGRGNWWPSRPQHRKPDRRRNRSNLTQIRNALAPNFIAKRRQAAQPITDTPDDTTAPDDAEPALPTSELPPVETDEQQTAERQPVVLAIALGRRAGGRLDR